MEYLIDGEQMKAIDNYSINQLGIPSLILMEKAAMACAEVISKTVSMNDRILAVCGIGNNGGDGIATARILKEWGLDVSVLLIGEEEKASEQTKKQLEIGYNLDLPIFHYKNSFNDNEELWNEYNIIVDAIFGIGLSRPVVGDYKAVIDKINICKAKIFSVDIPSGIDATCGKVWNTAIKADVTITFGYNKLGLVFYPGTEYAGTVIVKDIGFPKKAEKSVVLNTFTYDKTDKARLPKRKAYSNKGTYGRVLVIGGAKNMAGAVCLAANSAYRMGAGLVKILTVEENRIIVQSRLPEALVSTVTKDTFTKEWFLKEISWATVIVIGPGLSTNSIAETMLDLVLKTKNVPCVIDADALNLIAQKESFEAINQNPQIILTPHVKEMARLSKCDCLDITSNLLAFTKERMKEKAYTLVLKDARTIVTNGVETYINLCGNSGMAVGGSGDVLSGVIGGLLAQGMKPFEAASLGVYFHGLAGDYAASEKNEYSMIAGDITSALIEEISHEGVL